MAHITLTGNLGSTPELKQSKNGTAYAKFSLAWNEYIKDSSGQGGQGPTVWIQVTAFGRIAQNVCESLAKGMRVDVSGDLKPESWASDRGEETVLTLSANKVSPALDFQVVQVAKAQNNNSQGGYSQGGQYGGNQRGGQQGSQGGGNWGGSSTGGFGAGSGGAGVNNDEPPF